MNYEVSNAAGAQVNATATINIGSKSFSAQTEAGSSILAQGAGSLVFEIDVESMTTSGSSNIELEFTAQTVVFSVPGADAKLEFLWGSEDDASSLEATIPLLDMFMVEPEVEGSDVYTSVSTPLGVYPRLPSRNPSTCVSTVSWCPAIPSKRLLAHGKGNLDMDGGGRWSGNHRCRS